MIEHVIVQVVSLGNTGNFTPGNTGFHCGDAFAYEVNGEITDAEFANALRLVVGSGVAWYLGTSPTRPAAAIAINADELRSMNVDVHLEIEQIMDRIAHRISMTGNGVLFALMTFTD
ncbi:MAG: hypothetical protein V4611_03870 [Patescibacteria group bacterium]